MTDESEGGRFDNSPHNVWYCFLEFVNLVTEIFTTLALFLYVLDTTRSYEGGPLFALLCVMKPIVSVTFQKYLWNKCVCHYPNPRVPAAHEIHSHVVLQQ